MSDEKKRGYSDAQRKASVKFISENRDRYTIIAPKGTKDRWRQAAEAVGMSLNQYVCEAVDRRIAAEELFGGSTGVTTTREDA